VNICEDCEYINKSVIGNRLVATGCRHPDNIKKSRVDPITGKEYITLKKTWFSG